ncbi:hypothetical protein M5005_Spy0912 [Streptococcus pyogenes MGAS5005]|nr:hypothetical protein M5005_Spy0912 [Streptococcus pyogenes MGAS5005]
MMRTLLDLIYKHHKKVIQRRDKVSSNIPFSKWLE